MKLVTEILEITAHPSMDSTFVIHPLEPEFQLENDLPEQLTHCRNGVPSTINAVSTSRAIDR